MKKEEVKKTVRAEYANIAMKSGSCCTPVTSCCGTESGQDDISKKMGYTEEDLSGLPEGANLGLGCGNPVALASLKEGDTYLDLGSGAGIDCFIASKKVGKNGKVIGVDMTHEMLEKARENARKGGYDNVEFRLGEIEHLPVADNTVEVITSNCVINLSPDKKAVFEEALRVLKPGGRIMISDIVLLKELPQELLDSIEAYVGCISGAMLKDDYLKIVKETGFTGIKIESEVSTPPELFLNDPQTRSIVEQLNITEEFIKENAGTIVSLKFSAVKPE